MRWNLRVSRLLCVALNLLAFAVISAPYGYCSYGGSEVWNAIFRSANPSYTVQWTPDGGHIVFTIINWGRHYIYVAASDGSRLWTISDAGEDGIAYSPDISPDGSRIAYATTYDLRFYNYPALDIETSRLDGSNRRRLTDNEEDDASPVWSPDGSRIAFVKPSLHGGDAELGIYTMASDGSDLRLILHFSSGLGWPAKSSSLRWSPDGKMLAFVLRGYKSIRVESEPSDESSRRGIRYSKDDEGRIWATWYREVLYTMNADGSRRTNLLELAYKDGNSIFVGSPAWSPDGESIAAMTYSDEHFRVNTINSDGSGVRELAILHSPSYGNQDNTHGNRDISLSWSPDGTKILFSGLSGLGINVVNEDGSGLHRVAGGQYASWSPDGSRIVVTSGYGGDKKDFFLVTMAPDGSDRRVLVTRDEDGDLKAVYEKPGSPWMALGIAGGVVLAIVGLIILRRVLRRRSRGQQATSPPVG